MSDELLSRNLSQKTETDTAVLFRRWQDHRDTAARDQLVERFLPLAYKLARRYQGAREPVGDLKQVAAMGLVKAIDGYDLERGYGFAAYAVPSILGELRRYFRDCGWSVHVPRGLQELALKVEQARRELLTEHPNVTAVMIAEHLQISTEDVSAGLEVGGAHHALSFEAPTGDGEDGSTIGSAIGFIDPAFSVAEARADVARASRMLTEREKTVVALRFEADMTQAEIASKIGVSQMQVSRILSQALTRLATGIGEEEGTSG